MNWAFWVHATITGLMVGVTASTLDRFAPWTNIANIVLSFANFLLLLSVDYSDSP